MQQTVVCFAPIYLLCSRRESGLVHVPLIPRISYIIMGKLRVNSARGKAHVFCADF